MMKIIKQLVKIILNNRYKINKIKYLKKTIEMIIN